MGPQWPTVTGSKKYTVVRGPFFLTCDPPTHRVTVKKNSFIRPKKKGVGLGGLGESGDSSGESVWWWSDSGLFAAAAITQVSG